MKLYFCLFFFVSTLSSMYFALFVCCAHHRPVWDLCGWLFLLITLFFDVRGRHAQRGVAKGKC